MKTRVIRDHVGDFWLVQKWSTEPKPSGWADVQAFKYNEYQLACEFAQRLSMTKIPVTSSTVASEFEDGSQVAVRT
jgi:hypothetical protein